MAGRNAGPTPRARTQSDPTTGDDLLKAEMEALQQQMGKTKKNERAEALETVKRLCKEFGFTAGMFKGALTEGRKKK